MNTRQPKGHRDKNKGRSGRFDEQSFSGIEENILNASRAMVNILAESLIREGGEQITVPQFRILDMVANFTNQPGEIARMLSVSPSAITFLLERLEEKGLLIRSVNPKDRRCIVLFLTDKGKELVNRVNRSRKSKIAEILHRMDDRARSQLMISLHYFYRAYLET